MTRNPRPGRLVSRDDFFYVSKDNYDEHAELAIPKYMEMHKDLARLIKRYWATQYRLRLLDLGAGTGKTTEIVLASYPNGTAFAVDKFPEMLRHAQVRLESFGDNVEYQRGDFMEMDFGLNYDVCVSALAIHHQDPAGKRYLFRKVFNSLSPRGLFLMIDWTRFADPDMQESAFDIAEAHVRETLSRVPDVMREWVSHWRHLNIPDTVEDMCDWLREAGFVHAECVSRYYGMALICATKDNR